MDSITLASYYSQVSCKFRDAANLVSKQEILGTWPVNYKVTRIMMLYVFAIAQVESGANILTDNQILTIVARMTKLKYQQ